MSKEIELIFDFVSPNAYLTWYPLRDIAERTGASITITPVFLGGLHKLTGNAPPFIRDAEVKGKNEYAMLEMQRFIAKHGLNKWMMNPHFPFNSVTLQRVLCTMDQAERVSLIEALLPAIWHDGLNVGDAEAVGGALTSAGYDAQTLMEKTQDPAIKQALIDNTEAASARGVFGIPSFFIGDELFFGKERLSQIEELLER